VERSTACCQHTFLQFLLGFSKVPIFFVSSCTTTHVFLSIIESTCFGHSSRPSSRGSRIYRRVQLVCHPTSERFHTSEWEFLPHKKNKFVFVQLVKKRSSNSEKQKFCVFQVTNPFIFFSAFPDLITPGSTLVP
jgi:hypothetical protein